MAGEGSLGPKKGTSSLDVTLTLYRVLGVHGSMAWGRFYKLVLAVIWTKL
jgi:hypothetical protein